MRAIRFAVIGALVAISLGSEIAQAQRIPDYPRGVSPVLDKDKIGLIRSALRADTVQWGQVLRLYYGETYNRDLADLVVYINSSDSVKLGLVKKDCEGNELFGEKNLWVLIFADKQLNYKDTQPRNPEDTIEYAFDVRRESLQYEPEPSEYSVSGLVTLVAQVLTGSGIGGKAQPQALKDSTVKMALYKYVDDGDSMFVNSASLAKFSLPLNSVSRIVVTPKKPNHGFRNVAVNFGNYEASRLGASVGVGYTFGDEVIEKERVKFYLNGLFFLSRPTVPKSTFSLGLLAGTNLLKATFLSDIVLAVRLGLFITGQSAIVLGVNFGLADSAENGKRKGRPFIGIDYKL
jgi:hypothetical protein